MEKVITENRHKVSNALAQDDPTYENYLRLAEWIFTGKVLTSDLQDSEESRKRMQEIDELRANGGKTEYEEYNSPNAKKQKGNKNLGKKRTIVEVTDLKIKKKTYYTSIREFCEVTDTSRTVIKNQFKKAQNNFILHEGLLIKKVEQSVLESKIKPHRIYLNSKVDSSNHKNEWNDYEKAFVAQNRPQMKWKSIAIYLGRTAEACSNVMRVIKKEDKLDFYRSIDISDKFKL